MQGLITKLFIALVLVVGIVIAEGDVVVLTDSTFDAQTASGEWLLEFYAPWCGHCKRLTPIYDELATKVKGQYNIAKIDCTVEKALAQRFAIRGYPTIKFLKEGKLYDYSGARDVNSFVDYLNSGYATANNVPVPKAGAPPAAAATENTNSNKKSDVVILTDSNFEELTSKGTWFLEFYAPWCGHCKRLAPIYEEVATQLKGTVNVGKVDCTEHRGVCSQYDISGYPTIYYRRDNELRSYENQRTAAAFKAFADGGWKDTPVTPLPEPLSGMSLLANQVISMIENMSVNMYVVIGACIVVGVLLGACVMCMTPSSSSNKTIHYTPAPSSSSADGEIITEEVSKSD